MKHNPKGRRKPESFAMMKWFPSLRRSLAIALIVLGAALMFLAPETWAGLALLIAGAAVELTGIALRKRDAG
jgi:drug/metabolite transporter (DMT)-like permease